MKIILLILFSNFVFAQAIPGTKVVSSGPPSDKYSQKISVNDSKIYSVVEQNAEFPGGNNQFIDKVTQNFDGSVLIGEKGVVTSEILFVIEKDGSISDVKARGGNVNFNNEAIRAVKSIKTKWMPAKINSVPVRYFYKLPMTMTFHQ